jgi:hypothetical protein
MEERSNHPKQYPDFTPARSLGEREFRKVNSEDILKSSSENNRRRNSID